MIKIILNGQEKNISPINLKGLIEQFCKETAHVIAEVNGEIIKSHAWSDKKLSAGDSVELINFVGGG